DDAELPSHPPHRRREQDDDPERDERAPQDLEMIRELVEDAEMRAAGPEHQDVRVLRRSVGQALLAELCQRLLGLREVEGDALEDAFGLRELDLVVLHELDQVPARISNVEEAPGEDLDTRALERFASRLLVVDHEPEMRLLRARAALEEGDELVAHLEEGGV